MALKAGRDYLFFLRLLAVVCLALAAIAPVSTAADRALYGPSADLARALDAPISVHWQDVPVRQAVERLQQSQRLCIWLDRRVDPTLEVTLSLRDTPLRAVVAQLAAAAQAAPVATGNVLYVAPEPDVRDLRTLLALGAEQAERLPPAVRARLLQPTPMTIDRLAQPREVVARLARQVQVRVENPEAIPLDLWPATTGPETSIADQWTLLLFGFDLTWQATSDGRAVRIVPIERPVVVQRVYSRQALDKLPSGVIDPQAVAPGPGRQQVTVTARVEDDEAIAGSTSPRPTPRRPQRTRQVYSLRVQQQPVGAILQQLARQLGKELDVDQELKSGQSWSERVSFEVSQASLQELLDAVTAPAGLTATVEGDTVRVTRAGQQ